MKKKVISILLCVALQCCLVSCDSSETGVVINEPVVVAVGTEESADYYAALDFTSTNGYELVKYQSRQAAVIAVENAKADYVVINDKTATKEFIENTDLVWQKNTAYKIEYCAVFNKEDKALKQAFDEAIESLKEEDVFEDIKNSHYLGEQYVVDENNQTEGTITVICSPVFENMLYYDENGEITGCELFIINELCNKLGVSAELYVCQDFDDMFTSLEKGEGDVIISAVSYTDERATTHLLSEPYSETEFGIYKRKY